MTKPELKELLSKYNTIKREIKLLKIELNDYDTLKGVSYRERVQSNNIADSTLDAVIKKEEQRRIIGLKIKRLTCLKHSIEMLVELLDGDKKRIIQGLYFENMNVINLSCTLGKAERTIYRNHEKALDIILDFAGGLYVGA